MPNIQSIFQSSFHDYCAHFQPSAQQRKAAFSILNCKSGKLGYNIAYCPDCHHTQIHNNSCRDRNCPNCQSVQKELWIDARKAEVVDAPYFHAVFTLPAQLNPLLYANQSLLYSLLHQCASATLLQLAADPKYLGAVPGIIQVLHTWGQELNFHPHIHCIVSGGGLTKARQWKKSSAKFFIPVAVLGAKFRGMFLARLQTLREAGKLSFPDNIDSLRDSAAWNAFRDTLYKTTWIPFLKETFNGSGNAIDYLGRYTHRIAISNSRIKAVSHTQVTFSAKDYRTGKTGDITLSNVEFLRRFLMHVLPKGFRRIRYYGFLCNRCKKANLLLIQTLTGKALFCAQYRDMPKDQLLLVLFKIDVHRCPICGGKRMRQGGHTHYLRN